MGPRPAQPRAYRPKQASPIPLRGKLTRQAAKRRAFLPEIGQERTGKPRGASERDLSGGFGPPRRGVYRAVGGDRDPGGGGRQGLLQRDRRGVRQAAARRAQRQELEKRRDLAAARGRTGRPHLRGSGAHRTPAEAHGVRLNSSWKGTRAAGKDKAGPAMRRGPAMEEGSATCAGSLGMWGNATRR